MRTGHLFAGIDGLGLGMEPHGFEPAWFSEFEDAPSRLLAHHYPHVPNHGDITQIDWSKVEPVDVLTGGFPCQDLSYAGKGAGIKEGTRSGLWFRFADAIRHLRPRLVVIENVRALTLRGGDIVLGDLASLGFDAWWTVLRASDAGAAHRRERLFIVAWNAEGRGQRARISQRREDRSHKGPVGSTGRITSHPNIAGSQGREPTPGRDVPAWGGAWGDYEPAIRRWESVLGRPAPAPAIDGRLSPEFVEWHMGFPQGWTAMLSRTQRLKALGNAVVPQCASLVGAWALDIARQEVAA